MRVATRLHEGAYGTGGLGLAQKDAVHAARKDLAELPGREAHVRLIGPVDHGLDDDRRGPVSRLGGTSVDEALHVGGKARHVEGAVLHAHVDVVGPGVGVVLALFVGQDMPGVATGVVDRLPGLEELDCPVDACCHGYPFRRQPAGLASGSAYDATGPPCRPNGAVRQYARSVD